MKSWMYINGHTCRVSMTTSPFWGSIHSRKAHWRHKLGFPQRDFHIFINSAPGYKQRIFIVPWSVLGPGYYYMPLEELQTYDKPQRIDWWSYENAWHLFKEKKD